MKPFGFLSFPTFNLIKQNVEKKTGINQPIQEMPFWGNWENFIDNWMKFEKIQIQ